MQTIRHFFPELNTWLDDLPDSRDQDCITYERRFLAWWGIALYLFQLGSRRQLDFDLASAGTGVLANLNRLAQAAHTTRPVHDTLYHFLGHSRADPRIQRARHDPVRRAVVGLDGQLPAYMGLEDLLVADHDLMGYRVVAHRFGHGLEVTGPNQRVRRRVADTALRSGRAR